VVVQTFVSTNDHWLGVYNSQEPNHVFAYRTVINLYSVIRY